MKKIYKKYIHLLGIRSCRGKQRIGVFHKQRLKKEETEHLRNYFKTLAGKHGVYNCIYILYNSYKEVIWVNYL